MKRMIVIVAGAVLMSWGKTIEAKGRELRRSGKSKIRVGEEISARGIALMTQGVGYHWAVPPGAPSPEHEPAH